MLSDNKMDESKIDRCLICFGDLQEGISFFDYFKKMDCICGLCAQKFKLIKKEIDINGMRVFALYEYDDYLEDLMFTFKENKDVALYPVFLNKHTKFLKKKYRKATLVFAPSSIEKEAERGFQTLPLLFRGLNLSSKQVFEKKRTYKQSSQQFANRKDIKNVITLKKGVPLPKQIVLVDDMCTSGETLRTMYELVKQQTNVRIFTIAINKKLLK